MDTLTSLNVFREVSDGGSFVAAARRLNMSTAMVSKHVAHVEKRVGARLLNRTSRHLSLTEAGTLYLAQCREALDLLQSADASISQRLEAPQGVLKATAPVWCANRRFADMLAAYRLACPGVMLDLRLENRRVDLVEEGYDLALRVTREPTPSLIVRPICELQFRLVGSAAFLRRHAAVKAPSDLAGLGAVLPTYVNIENLRLDGPAGSAAVRLRAVMKTDDTTLAYHAVHAGIGIAYLPDWLVADDLRSGALLQLLPDHRTPVLQLFAAYTSRKYMTGKVRSFIDFVGEALRSG